MAALAAAGVIVYRTDLNGTIVATATEDSVWFDTEKVAAGQLGLPIEGNGTVIAVRSLRIVEAHVRTATHMYVKPDRTASSSRLTAARRQPRGLRGGRKSGWPGR